MNYFVKIIQFIAQVMDRLKVTTCTGNDFEPQGMDQMCCKFKISFIYCHFFSLGQ